LPAPLDRPNDLAVPADGSTTSRSVISRALGRLCRELPATVRAHAGGALREDALAIDRTIASLATRDPGALASVLRRPHTSTLARTLRSADADAPALASELFALLAFDFAWLGALPSPVTLRSLPRRLVSLTARLAVELPSDVSAATFSNGSLVCELPAARQGLRLDDLARGEPHPWCSRPYRTTWADVLLALADNNPLSTIEAHPEKTTPNTVSLGERSEDEWVGGIRSALSTIETALPAMAVDIRVVLQQIVPTGYDAEKHLSCSYQEDIGTLYATLHPSPLTMAEAIIHEVSHNKLNAFFDLDPLLENGRGELYASPVRPDPRPIHGVLLAVHAFVPVARMYEALVARCPDDGGPLGPKRNLEARLAAIVESNRAGTEVLRAHARATPIGKGLLDELFRWDDHYRR
jgi:HEXXH motif-containing protein